MITKRSVKNNICFLVITLLAVSAICCICVKAYAVEGSEQFNWSQVTPLDFLDILKNRAGFVVIKASNYPPGSWITKEHVKILMGLIGSHDAAASVVSELSQQEPFLTSSVGNEAMFLIEGFRKGVYPPSLCSVSNFKADAQEYGTWWEAESGSGQGPRAKVGGFL